MRNEWYKKISDLLELQEFLSVIERDKKGNPIKLGSPNLIGPNKTRLAENENDFEEIYKKEFAKYKTTIENISIYIKEFKEIINAMIATYKKTRSYNKRDSNLLNTTYSFINFLDGKIPPKKNENPHPQIFEDGAFEIFNKWLDISNDKQDKRISFIIQKLKQEGKLRKTAFKDVVVWAYQNNFIEESNYNKMLIKGFFHSPSQILTKGRLELYSTIKHN